MTSSSRSRTTAVLTLIAMAGLASQLDVQLVARGAEDSALLRRVIAETTRSNVTVRAMRDLRAGTRSGKHQGWMAVETVQSPSGQFTWRVLNEGGSERTRNKVFRELLDAEASAWQAGARDAAALTPANYEFVPLAPSPNGQVRIQLKPRREDPRLIDGTLTVSSDGYPVLLEGRLAKSPSFWVRSVSVVKRFARIGGVALPTAIESVADVKLVGMSTFSMSYLYHEVNGRYVAQSASAPTTSRGAFALALQPGSN